MKACPQCKLKYPNDKHHCFADGSILVEIQDPRVGTTVAGRYELQSVLGTGGMATVYAATHRLVDRPCAVKIMDPKLAKDEVIRERFRREAKAAQKLAHPNIIQIFDQGETDDGCVYLVMELLEGQTLSGVVEDGPLPLSRALPLLIQVARALARAHDLQVIHRDLKPDNIFLAINDAGEEVAKLLDFGIARSMQDPRLTGAGEVFGTPEYMAPERVTTIDAGPKADLYAVGVIVFEVVTGELPFQAIETTDFFVKHMREPPPNPRDQRRDIPEALNTLILELLEKEPADRPVDAHRLHADLCAIATQLEIPIPPDPGDSESSEQVRSRTLPPIALDRWVRRTGVFEEMLHKVYGEQRPPELSRLLDQVKSTATEVGSVRSQAVEQQRLLESIEARGRDARQRFGHAVDALGIDASHARDKLKASQNTAHEVSTKLDVQREQFLALHEDAVYWEGRSGFAHPYPDLAKAYQKLADHVRQWDDICQKQRAAEDAVHKGLGDVADLEFQIEQLRQALASNEESLENEQAACQRKVEELGKRAGELEAKLLELASQFCEPLRQHPELQPLFQELETEAAA